MQAVRRVLSFRQRGREGVYTLVSACVKCVRSQSGPDTSSGSGARCTPPRTGRVGVEWERSQAGLSGR